MNLRVLFADSDVEMLDLYRKFFRSCWYDVDTVANGVECISALQRNAPDVLVVNDNLLWGGLDGVLDLIRQDSGAPHIQVVTIEASRPSSRDSPVVATVAVPFRLGELDALLRSILKSCRLFTPSDPDNALRQRATNSFNERNRLATNRLPWFDSENSRTLGGPWESG